MHEIIKSNIQLIGDSVEIIGVFVILSGFFLATVFTLKNFLAKKYSGHALFQYYRQSLARAILVGLEFLVAGDIIRTVAGDLTLVGIATLGGIVLIRIVLGITLETEIEPTTRVSWRKHQKQEGA